MEYRSPSLIETPKVSVFILTYNQENMVGQAIESVLSQETDFSFEVIIAEDRSQDNTLKKCLEYYNNNPEKILVISHPHNKGLIRNYFETLSEYARGKYIAQCAGDDWWLDKRKLQKQVDFLEKNGEYSLVYTKSMVYMHDSNKFMKNPIGFNCEKFEQMILNNGIPALTVCFTKNAFMEYVHEVDPVNRFADAGEDYPMWIWFSFRKKIYFMHEITSAYRMHKNSIFNKTISNHEKLYKCEKYTLKIKHYFLDLFKISDQTLLKKVLLEHYIYTMNFASMINGNKDYKDREKMFIENKLYILYLISKLYTICGKNKLLNKTVNYIEKVCRRIGVIKY